jgi:hypothetical protein
MTKIIRINTDGDITRLEGWDMLARASEEFASTSCVACVLAPFLRELGVFVMVIDDFGAEDMPINMKAWALYGRSPIFGTAFFGYDSDEGGGRSDLPESLIDMVSQPIESWVDAPIIAHMKANAVRPDMLITRAEAES